MHRVLFLAVLVLGTAASADSATHWVDGPDANVVFVVPFLQTHVGYAANPEAGLPRAYTPFYAHLVVTLAPDLTGSTFYVRTELQLPPGMRLAVSDALPVRCFVTARGQAQSELPREQCPQTATAADHGLSFVPPQLEQWPVLAGQALELWFPVVTDDVARAAMLGAAVQLQAAFAPDWALPAVSVDVGPLPAPRFDLASPTLRVELAGSVTVDADVTTYGRPGTLFLDRGRTESYGASTVVRTFAETDAAAVLVSSRLSGLEPGATYHWRLRFVDANGESFTSADEQFSIPEGASEQASAQDAGTRMPSSSEAPPSASETKQAVAQGCSASPMGLDWLALVCVALLAGRGLRRVSPVLSMVVVLAAGSARAGDDVQWVQGDAVNVANEDADNHLTGLMATTSIGYQKGDAEGLPHLFRTFYARVLVTVPASAYVYGNIRVLPGVKYADGTYYPSQQWRDLPIRCFVYRTGDAPSTPSPLCPEGPDSLSLTDSVLQFPTNTAPYQWTVQPGQTLEVWFSVNSMVTAAQLAGYVEFFAQNAVKHDVVVDSAKVALDVHLPPNPTFDLGSPVTQLTSSSVHLSGAVDSYSADGDVYLDLGTSPISYDPPVLLGETDSEGPTQFSADVTRLASATTYHWRLRFVGLDGVVAASEDHTFTTLARPPDAPPDAGVSSAPPDAGFVPGVTTTSNPDPSADPETTKPKQGCSATPWGLDGLALWVVGAGLATRRKRPVEG